MLQISCKSVQIFRNTGTMPCQMIMISLEIYFKYVDIFIFLSDQVFSMNFQMQWKDPPCQRIKFNFHGKIDPHKIKFIVRNHVKLLHVYKSRRGFSKGTVLCGGY